MNVKVGRAVTILALTALSACANEHPTDALLRSPRFDIVLEGTDARVCVSSNSPSGNYTFTVSNIDFAAGGSTVPGTNPAVIAPGACFTLVSRLQPQNDADPAADPFTTVTYSYTSNTVVGGAAYVATTCVDDPTAPASDPCGETVVSHVNFVHPTVATFSFVSSVQKIEDLRAAVSNLDISKPAMHEIDDRLRDASREAGKGHIKGACNQIDQFIKKLNDLSKKTIEDSDAAKLSSDAEAIQEILGC
jgi:hypothetical protein